jgi:hypothetical protein
MNIQLEMDKLKTEKSDLEAVIETHKERIKAINLKLRKLDTVLKHAQGILTDQEGVREHEESEA